MDFDKLKYETAMEFVKSCFRQLTESHPDLVNHHSYIGSLNYQSETVTLKISDHIQLEIKKVIT